MTDITSKQKNILNNHAKEIKVGNFKELIYEGWNYNTKTIAGVLQLLREAEVYPFNHAVLLSDTIFTNWILKVVDLGQMNDYAVDLATIKAGDPNAKSKLTIAEALGTSCYKVTNSKSPHYGMFIVTNKYSSIDMLLDSRSWWFPRLKMEDLTVEF